jgi:threonine/homoserine/homoserine lactone efflux protein
VQTWIVPALGVALSPLPVLAMLLVLGGARPTAVGSAFWGAWTLGIALPTVGLVVLAESVDEVGDDAVALAAAQIVIGLLLLAFVFQVARSTPRPDRNEPPLWLVALDRAGGRRAASLALVLSALNPKNLALMLAAAVSIAHAGDHGGELTAATLGFVLVAASTISALLAGHTLLAERTQPALERLRHALARNDRVIAIVLGTLIGVFFVLDGLRAL